MQLLWVTSQLYFMPCESIFLSSRFTGNGFDLSGHGDRSVSSGKSQVEAEV